MKKQTHNGLYSVDDLGNVYGQTGQVLKGILKNGYRAVRFWDKRKFKAFYVHRLILETFIGPCPKGAEACHNNGIPTDNRLENLRWDSRQNNQLDRHKHGTDNKGIRHPMAKYTEKFVLKVRRLCKKHQQKDVAAMLCLPRSTVSSLVRYRWQHLK